MTQWLYSVNGQTVTYYFANVAERIAFQKRVQAHDPADPDSYRIYPLTCDDGLLALAEGFAEAARLANDDPDSYLATAIAPILAYLQERR